METMGTAQDLENIGVKSTHLCWCHVGALQMCLMRVSLLFWPIAPSQRIINARARDTCPRNCRSRRRSTARVRHGRNHAHEALVFVGPEFARVAHQLRLHLAHFVDHVHLRLHLPQRVVGGLLGQSLVEVAKLSRAPSARSTVERLHRHGHVQAEQLLEESTDSEAVS